RTTWQNDLATRLRCEKRQQLRTADLLAKKHMARRINTVRLKNMLGDIQPDDANLPTRTPPSSGVQHLHSGTKMPSGGVHPITDGLTRPSR
ncbi:MAG: hypothetical protein ACOYLK_00005, partial [Sphingomonas sp.]